MRLRLDSTRPLTFSGKHLDGGCQGTTQRRADLEAEMCILALSNVWITVIHLSVDVEQLHGYMIQDFWRAIRTIKEIWK